MRVVLACTAAVAVAGKARPERLSEGNNRMDRADTRGRPLRPRWRTEGASKTASTSLRFGRTRSHALAQVPPGQSRRSGLAREASVVDGGAVGVATGGAGALENQSMNQQVPVFGTDRRLLREIYPESFSPIFTTSPRSRAACRMVRVISPGSPPSRR